MNIREAYEMGKEAGLADTLGALAAKRGTGVLGAARPNVWSNMSKGFPGAGQSAARPWGAATLQKDWAARKLALRDKLKNRAAERVQSMANVGAASI